jgi:hypothetical protein
VREKERVENAKAFERECHRRTREGANVRERRIEQNLHSEWMEESHPRRINALDFHADDPAVSSISKSEDIRNTYITHTNDSVNRRNVYP